MGSRVYYKGQIIASSEFKKYSTATQSEDGLMSAADKKKLDDMVSEVNDINTQLDGIETLLSEI